MDCMQRKGFNHRLYQSQILRLCKQLHVLVCFESRKMMRCEKKAQGRKLRSPA